MRPKSVSERKGGGPIGRPPFLHYQGTRTSFRSSASGDIKPDREARMASSDGKSGRRVIARRSNSVDNLSNQNAHSHLLGWRVSQMTSLINQ